MKSCLKRKTPMEVRQSGEIVDVEIDGEARTAIKFIVSPRSYSRGGSGINALSRPETPAKGQSAEGEGTATD